MTHTIVVTKVKQTVLEFSDDEWDDMQAEGDVSDIIYEVADNASWTTVEQIIEEV